MSSKLGWKRLVENIFSLSVFQFASYGISFVMMPYLIHALGIGGFGKVTYSFAIVSLVGLVVEYGFEISATKKVSINRNRLEDIGEYISALYVTKFSILLLGLVFLLILTTFKNFSEVKDLIFLSYIFVFAKAITPLWFFQGLEEMKIVALVNLVTRLFYFITVLIIVKSQEQIDLVPLLNGLSALLTGLFCLWYAKSHKSMVFGGVSINTIMKTLKDGFHIFISQISTTSLTHLVPFVLGVTSGAYAVGLYSAAEKMVQAVFGLFVPFQQSFFPWIAAHLKNNPITAIKLLKSSMAILFGVMVVVGLLLYQLSGFIMLIITGEHNIRSIETLELLAIMPLLLSMNSFIGVQVLINLGLSKQYSRIVALSLPVALGLLLILTPNFKEYGAAISVISTETMILLMLLYTGINGLMSRSDLK